MPAIATRQAVREQITSLVARLLDEHIPLDESVQLRGGTMLEFEDTALEVSDAVHVALLEARAQLDAAAQAKTPGACPRCGSAAVHLTQERRDTELISLRGPVRVSQQRCRCRACDASFSPSGQRLAAEPGQRPHPAGARPARARGRRPAVRAGRQGAD